ncbi:MAG: hypothetical protein O7E52_22140 [Candidatus Poribacteria bacterium]|nr:hypothetical protein [Candidatus Poribacteria bacterium]
MKKARLLSISFPGGGYGSVESNREQMVAYLEKAGAYRGEVWSWGEVFNPATRGDVCHGVIDGRCIGGGH